MEKQNQQIIYSADGNGPVAERIRYAVIGSGWRSLYYARIAKALPERFQLVSLLCRTQEKADLMKEKHQVPATASVSECLSAEPDFVVVAVDREHIAQVSLEWLERGMPVLAETPAAIQPEDLERLRQQVKDGKKFSVAEQYTRQAENAARLDLIRRGVIGQPDYIYLSLAHDYHGASLMRAFLDLPAQTPFMVTAQEFSFPTTETLNRYERFTDGRISDKKRTIGCFVFDSGAVGVYDFDSEQYRSPIRGSLIKVQGSRGELTCNTVRWLDKDNLPHLDEIKVETRLVETDDDNPNLHSFPEVTGITWRGESLYTPPFGLCGLSQDETAIATMLQDMGAYVRGQAGPPYPSEEALRDALAAMMLREVVLTGAGVRCE